MSVGSPKSEGHQPHADTSWSVVAREFDQASLTLWADLWRCLHESQTELPFYLHTTWLSALGKLIDNPLVIVCAYANNPSTTTLPDIMVALVQPKRQIMTLPVHDHLTLGGALVNPALTHADIDSAISAMMATCDVSKIEFGNLPNDSPVLVGLPCTRGGDTGEGDTGECDTGEYNTGDHRTADHHTGNPTWLKTLSRESAWFDLRGDAPVLPGKLRRNLQRLHRKLMSTGKVATQFFEGEDAITAFDTFLTVEASGWKGTEGTDTAIAQSPKLTEFYRELLEPRHPGLVPMINQLTVDDEVVAVQLALRTGQCTYILKIGYLEAYAQYAPGSLLIESVITQARANGQTRLSLVTNPPWSNRWHPNIQPVWRLACHRTQTAAMRAKTVLGLKQTYKNLKVIRPNFLSGQ